MKYYETHYEEYIQSMEKYNLHPELTQFVNNLPKTIQELENLIVYGPIGSGKYTQVLGIIRKYSPSGLKYDKKMVAQTDKYSKYNYAYRISDVHYEIDMSLLGCNSKSSWHDIFFQIVDIVSIKQNKCGIILCKNFHAIHNELLDVFYSYMQHARIMAQNITIKFILLTEQYSFIPNNILNCSSVLAIMRPSKSAYEALGEIYAHSSPSSASGEITATKRENEAVETATAGCGQEKNKSEAFLKMMANAKKHNGKNINNILNKIDTNYLLNIKEIRSFSFVDKETKMPKDIFNIICDNIIHEMLNHKTLEYTTFRDHLYDILVYNLEITECIWYILHYFIYNGHFDQRRCISAPADKHSSRSTADEKMVAPKWRNKIFKGSENANISKIMAKIFVFLKHYNNNYRPIYHLESIFFFLLLQVNAYPNTEYSV